MSGRELGRLGEKEAFWPDEPEPAGLSTLKSFKLKHMSMIMVANKNIQSD